MGEEQGASFFRTNRRTCFSHAALLFDGNHIELFASLPFHWRAVRVNETL